MSNKSSNKPASSTMKFHDGATQFRLRLITSLLSHRPLLIRNIHADALETAPGLLPHEASFLRLLDSITNGTTVEINSTGTQLRFVPGVLVGGLVNLHKCPTTKSIGWFLEGILPLAPFGKEPLEIFFEGITDGMTHFDPSPDYIATAVLPLYRRFGVGKEEEEEGSPNIPQCRVIRRGAAPLGEGRVRFVCPIVREIEPIEFTDMGKFKRVRGNAISCKIAPNSAARVAYSAKGLLHKLLPDVWIHTDIHSMKHSKNVNGCGPSPGLGICLAAESTEGVVICVECSLDPNKARGEDLPEDLGTRGSALLLDEIRKGGCIDTSAQTFALLMMCLGPEDVARIRIGSLSRHSIVALRLFKEAFGVEFKVKTDVESKTIFMSCLGSGYRNMARAST